MWVSESDVHTEVALSLLHFCLWVRHRLSDGQLTGSAERAWHSARVGGPGIKKSWVQGQQKGDQQCSMDHESALSKKGEVRKKKQSHSQEGKVWPQQLALASQTLLRADMAVFMSLNKSGQKYVSFVTVKR